MKSKIILSLVMGSLFLAPLAPEARAADTLLRRDVYRAGATDKSYSSTAPQDSEYAIVRLWGAAGGPYGNDHMGQFSPPIGKSTPGGYGGFVSGKVSLDAGDKVTGVLGAPGVNGRKSGDNNDRWGTSGEKSTAVVGGREIMVAGGGSTMMLFNYSLSKHFFAYISPSPNGATFLENRRLNYASGGSPYAGLTKASGVTDATRTTVEGVYARYTGSKGGTGKKDGAYYVWPWFADYYHIMMTGGTSYVMTGSVSNGTYYSGDPAKNPSDGGAWKKYFEEDSKDTLPAKSGTVYAGGGGVVIEYWATQAARDVCSNISGAQASVPSGMTVDGSGNCVPVVVADMCPNIAGLQSSIPAGMQVDSSGNCVAVISACVALAPEIRTRACPAGQGIITERRTSTCPGPAWGVWESVSNTCSTLTPTDPVPPATPPSGPADSEVSVSGADLRIRFFGGGSAVSDSATVSVGRANFSGSVTLSIAGQGAFSNLPGDTTASYSFDGASFDSGTVSKTLSSGESSSGLKLRLSKPLPNACGSTVTSGCVDYAVTVKASASGAPDDTVRLRVIQTVLDPAYEES